MDAGAAVTETAAEVVAWLAETSAVGFFDADSLGRCCAYCQAAWVPVGDEVTPATIEAAAFQHFEECPWIRARRIAYAADAGDASVDLRADELAVVLRAVRKLSCRLRPCGQPGSSDIDDEHDPDCERCSALEALGVVAGR